VIGALLSLAALAHSPNTSLSTVTIRENEATIHLTLRARDADALGSRGMVSRGMVSPETASAETASAETASAETASRVLLTDDLVLVAAGVPCPASSARLAGAPAGLVRWSWTVTCPGSPDTLDAGGLVSALPRHLHLAGVETLGAETSSAETSSAETGALLRHEHALTADHPRAPLGEGGAAPQAPGALLAGLGHLLQGWDHLAFLALLALLPARLRALAWAVTGFTLGHMAALGLTASGVVVPAAQGVELLIAWSIVALAVETAWLHQARAGRVLPTLLALSPLALALLPGGPPALAAGGAALFMGCHLALLARTAHPERQRLRLTALFGLLHGFGFAGGLALLQPDPSALLATVLGFNLGVEVGQLAVLALVWPLLLWARRRWPNGVVELGAAVGVAVGVGALVARV
jgi:hypothetical protein